MAGVIVLLSKDALQHHGISLSMEGLVNLQLSSKSVGVFEAFYNSVKVQDARSDADSRLPSENEAYNEPNVPIIWPLPSTDCSPSS